MSCFCFSIRARHMALECIGIMTGDTSFTRLAGLRRYEPGQ